MITYPEQITGLIDSKVTDILIVVFVINGIKYVVIGVKAKGIILICDKVNCNGAESGYGGEIRG